MTLIFIILIGLVLNFASIVYMVGPFPEMRVHAPIMALLALCPYLLFFQVVAEFWKQLLEMERESDHGGR